MQTTLQYLTLGLIYKYASVDQVTPNLQAYMTKGRYIPLDTFVAMFNNGTQTNKNTPTRGGMMINGKSVTSTQMVANKTVLKRSK